jgi:hypothetical protein
VKNSEFDIFKRKFGTGDMLDDDCWRMTNAGAHQEFCTI